MESQSPSDAVLRQELEIARKTQSAMVPRVLPTIEGVEMAALHLPCGMVGGDLYDVIRIADDLIALIMFDVSGHGISSALIASMAKICFSNHIRSSKSPRTVIERVNADMIRNLSTNYFVTAFTAMLDLHNNRLTYCNAGHPYPVVYRKSEQRLIPLTTPGLFIGLFEDGRYEERSFFLHPGDWLLVFSDGMYGLFDGSNEKVQRDRFESLILSKLDRVTPQQLLEELRSVHGNRVSQGCIDDDISLVAVEVLTESRRSRLRQELGFGADDPVYLQFISYFEEMDRATSVILGEMDEHGYRDDGIRKMKIALTELLANAICHGNLRDGTKKVTIGHCITREKAVVAILDEGEGFNLGAVPDPTLPENLVKDCGRGIYIVRNYVDVLAYNDKGNCAMVTKFHASE